MLDDDGLRYPKLQTWVGFPVPFLIHEAAQLAGFEYDSLWIRDRVARLLAEELAGTEDALTYEEILATMPPSKRERPGFIKPGKPGVHIGMSG